MTIDTARAAAALVPFCGRAADVSRPVRVYRNLSGRGGRYSVAQGGLVVAHADRLMLGNVTFVVSAAGMARSRRIGKRVICAWAIGLLTDSGMGIACDHPGVLPCRISLDRQAGAFVGALTSPPHQVRKAAVVLFNEHGASAAYTS